MTWNANRSGSVLMEFIVVLPIYMLLLGFVFLVGEVSLHAINLASGDRLLALQRENPTWAAPMGVFERAASPTKTAAGGSLPEDRALAYRDGLVNADVRASSYDYRERAGLVADTSFRGAWSMVVAATVRDNYTLTPWTRGWVMFWVNHKSRTTEGEFDLEEGSALFDWMRTSELGRHVMVSKDSGVRRYGYYTLMRRRTRGAGQYRVGTGGIVDAAYTWRSAVAEEPSWSDEDRVASMTGIDGTDHSGQAGTGGGDRPSYARYPKFTTWSE